MLVSTLLLGLSFSDHSVSCTCRAEPLSHLVKDLSKATGLKLTVSKTCANDVLLISVQDVSTRELLAEIAKVDAGSWAEDPSGLKFVPNQAARSAEARAELARREKTIKAEIPIEKAETVKEEGEVAKNAPLYATKGLVTQETILGLLDEVDPQLLILEGTSRIVFSTNPNSMQLPLGPSAAELIANLVEKHNAANQALRDEKGTNEDDIQSVEPILGYSKADLVVSAVGPEPGQFEAQLFLYGSTGASLGQLDDTVSVPSDPSVEDATEDPKAAPTHPGTKIETSEAGKAFRIVYRSQRIGNSAMISVPVPLAPFLLDAEHNDPLAISTSDEILAIARSHKKPLVAVVPDNAFVGPASVGLGMDPGTTVEEFTRSLEKGETMTIAEPNGWTEIKPSNPATARRLRCDRASLGGFLRICVEESIPTLDQFAKFTAAVPDPQNNPIVMGYLTTLVSGYGNAGLGTIRNWNLYKIFGEFTQDQRAKLLNGDNLPLTILGPNQQTYLYEAVFGSIGLAQFGTGPTPFRKKFASAWPQTAEMPRPPQDFENEPTELLPEGIRENAQIEFSATDETFVSPTGPDSGTIVFPRLLGVGQLAKRQVMLSMPRNENNRDAIMFTSFRLGSRTIYTLTLHVSDKAFVSGRLFEFQLDNASPVLSMAELPQDWREETARRVEMLKKSMTQADQDKATAQP